jgi:hypothetical protein
VLCCFLSLFICFVCGEAPLCVLSNRKYKAVEKQRNEEKKRNKPKKEAHIYEWGRGRGMDYSMP